MSGLSTKSEPRYGRSAFWIVKVLMILGLAVWLHNCSKESGRQEILSNKVVKRITGDYAAFCYNGTFYPIVEFQYKKLIFKVKKEAPEGAVK